MSKAMVKTHNQRKRKTLIFIIVMMLIPIIHHFVFFLYPNVDSFFLAFQNETAEGTKFFTLSNFKFLWEDLTKSGGLVLEGLRNALIFWFFGSVFMFALSYIWSYFLYKRIAGRAFFRVIFYITSIVGISTTAAIFKFMLRDNGLIGQLYSIVTGKDSVPAFLLEEKYALKVMLMFVFWNGFGGSYIIFGGAFANIPNDVMEYSMIDGVSNMWTELWYLIIPLTWPTVSTLFLISLGTIFTSSGPILVLTGGAAGTYTLSYWIFERIWRYNNYYQPSAMGLAMTVLTLPIFFFSRWMMKKVSSAQY